MTATRLPSGGRLINRKKPIEFTFDGKKLAAYEGDTLASALIANDELLVGRSFKYHRPRGVVAAGPEEPNALFGTGTDGRFEPNQRGTTTEVFEGLIATSQNAWPSLAFDVGAINTKLAKFLTAGFYYKMFIHPRWAWKHVYEPFIRKAAGLGAAPTKPDVDTYEHFYAHADIVIIGGGVAGLTAALTAGNAGLDVLLLEQGASLGGRAMTDGGEIDGKPAATWVGDTIKALDKLPNVKIRTRTMGAGMYDHGYLIGYERLADHAPSAGPRHRLWRIRAGQVIAATGAIERPLSFANNDLPGILLAGAVRDYIADYGTAPGQNILVVTNNDDAYLTALAAKENGLEATIVDVRAEGGALTAAAQASGITCQLGKGLLEAKGKKAVKGAIICNQNGTGWNGEAVKCDCIAMSGGWSPVVHLWSHCGGKLNWDDTQAFFRPDASRPPTGDTGQAMVKIIGTANGHLDLADVLKDAFGTAKSAVKEAGGKAPSDATAPTAKRSAAVPIAPVWKMPAQADLGHEMKTWLDYQNDVKLSDVRLAAREGYESVEHTKRYTTLGMASDQGKLSNINGLAILADSLNADIPAVGTTTFRPPYHPISMAAIAGDQRGPLFKPVRQTPIHEWIEANGGHWEPVADWRRPYCYMQDGESVEDAVTREILNTRQNVGLLDASTLGKIIVKGKDAGKFLDLMYTNMMSTLKPGKCRYGLMCNENGFLSDDGVVARIDEDTFLCHTTSGGSDRIHAWMEEWLQTEWWDMKVYTANVTEQYAQIAVVGPNARKVLEKLGGMDVSAEALPFMSFKDGELGGIKARPYRISFSGELSYEIAVPASQGQAFWDMCMKAGKEFGIQPYGTECLHVMRAEKGFIMIGDETDGTVIPQDLGLNWAISKKKTDFLGKRAQERSFLTNPKRWKLVGLKTVDPKTVIPDGAYATDGLRRKDGIINMFGRVTSTYFSPTLDRSIAMGLVENGPDRMGEVIEFQRTDGRRIKAEICDPVFLDPEGERQNV